MTTILGLLTVLLLVLTTAAPAQDTVTLFVTAEKTELASWRLA